ncbi:related to eukaryotic translation initiation factor 2C 3 [Lecanosticta acicola]|uniref:Related to eukaryotic translation initiation factor 2C 3 n=1 Tax=Lecanosticta acicola TaxID=111012 RepID=A0AAI8YZG4_9PEZI|nr:related to eukaryotic translation initiation factor 2C 3 [Lecanosticta acicola]
MGGIAKDRVEQQRSAASSRPSTNMTPSKASSSEASTGGGPSHSPQSSRGGARAHGYGMGGFDGNADPGDQSLARDPGRSRPFVQNKNLDLGVVGWNTVRGQDALSVLPSRPPPSKLGQATKIGLNTFHVTAFPDVPIYQFDVLIGSGSEKRGVIKKVWESKAVQDAVGDFTIFDGNKLAWSGKKIDREVRLVVDLDVEQGRTPKEGKPADQHRVVIRQTNKVAFQSLRAYLEGKKSFDNACLETINFADHLLRHTPSQRYSSIKRAFFKHGEDRFHLTGGIEAFKGVYQSLRVAHPGHLSVNLDVANGTFWVKQPFHLAAAQVCGARDPSDLVGLLSKGENGRAGKELKKMRKMRVLAYHRDQNNPDEYVIDRFLYKSAKEHKVQIHDPQGKEVETTLYDYFARKYKRLLQYAGLPLCKMTKGKNTVLPMECLMVKGNQRYAYKMDERQTSNMIKFAVTPPAERYQAIQHGLNMLSWDSDPMLKKYGLKINPTKSVADARLLLAPTVKFGMGDAKPGTSGRWDLKGKKFLQTNTSPLKSWAVCVVSGRRGGKPEKAVVEEFIKAFVTGYTNHGGKIENKQPAMSLAQSDDVGAWVTAAWNAAGNQSSSRPQILFFILPDKDSTVYGRIKRSCECRYGVVSQCVQYSQAQKKAPQYISNVCMKFNAKLGGITCRAIGAKTGGSAGIFQNPTMIIGADVSHAAPGQQTPSMAAITMSMDKLATRYAAHCQTNGFRIEMINTDVINELKSNISLWMQTVGGGKVPQTIIYMRDGVSEVQYQHVLQQEVNDMKNLLKGADPSGSTKFVVVIGSKRHHIRFFPEQGKGDRNGNAHPGTLVETHVTNPYENDFYLQSHAAIKGTARPCHYYVLMNETSMSNEMLQTLIYEHSYQYARASTPISQHPAIYYAHLASNRAIPHDPKWAGSTADAPHSLKKGMPPPGSGSQGGSKGPGGSQGQKDRTGSSSGIPTDFEKLMPMPNQGGINASMWYI